MSDQNWLKEHLNKIENKIDKLDGRIDNVDVTLAKQSIILEDHTRRSLANETQVELLKKKFEQELSPLKEHLIQTHTVFKVIGFLATLAGIGKGILEILNYTSLK